MAKPTRAAKRSAGNTVALDAHALGTLRYIRASMDAAGLLAVPGSAGVAMGTVGLLAMLLAADPLLARRWFAIWVGAAAVALATGSALIVHQAARAGAPLYRGPARKFLLCLSPPLLAGALITLALWRRHELATIPGIWLLLYGCGVTAASTLTLRPVAFMGVAFLALGFAALELPARFANLLLGGGFGGLHLIFGIVIGRMAREH
ncbi:MAG TPA: hypothetical protein VMU67_15800 [Steroidobacteraceae bacterium]|nr:hypothetical protein [Steroidobacteraceae bacterium]